VDHRQQLLWQEHVPVIAAIDLHTRVDKDEAREAKLWNTDGYRNRLTKCRSGAQLVANVNFNFPHTLGAVRYIIWVLFTIYSAFHGETILEIG